MIIVLEGPDSYRRLQKALEIQAVYKKKNPHAVVYEYDFENDQDQTQFREHVGTQSLFTAVRVIHIKNYTDAIDSKTVALLKRIGDGDSKTVAVLESEKKMPKWCVELAGQSKKGVQTQEFLFLDGAAWLRYVQKKAKDMGIVFDRHTIEYIAEVNKKNTWKLIRDMEKLALSASQIITKKEYEKICGNESMYDFFSLAVSIQAKQQSKKIRSIELLMRKGNDPAKIFNVAASLARDEAKKYAQLDVLIKSGRMDYDDALLALAIA
ncbi:MAG: hypothetical protein RIQ54_187 [Candidatus Parcubacteria bacterium]|jgi:DNA polymerase III delta subunit